MPTYQFPLEEQTKYPARIFFQVQKTTGYGVTVNDVQNEQKDKSIDNEATLGGAFADIGEFFGQLSSAAISKPEISYGSSVELYIPAGS